MSDTLTLDPATTAIVLIEYQERLHHRWRGAARRGRRRHGLHRDAGQHRAVGQRGGGPAGATIMHAPITFVSGYNEISAHPYGILKGVVDGNAFVKDSWGAAIIDVLAPQPGDIVVEGKRGAGHVCQHEPGLLCCAARASPRSSSALPHQLLWPTMRSDMRTAHRVLTLADCRGRCDLSGGTTAIRYDYPMFSRPGLGRCGDPPPSGAPDLAETPLERHLAKLIPELQRSCCHPACHAYRAAPDDGCSDRTGAAGSALRAPSTRRGGDLAQSGDRIAYGHQRRRPVGAEALISMTAASGTLTAPSHIRRTAAAPR